MRTDSKKNDLGPWTSYRTNIFSKQSGHILKSRAVVRWAPPLGCWTIAQDFTEMSGNISASQDICVEFASFNENRTYSDDAEVNIQRRWHYPNNHTHSAGDCSRRYFLGNAESTLNTVESSAAKSHELFGCLNNDNALKCRHI